MPDVGLYSVLTLTKDDAAHPDLPVPLVLLGDRIFNGPADHVTIQNGEVARAATEHLLATGRRRPHDRALARTQPARCARPKLCRTRPASSVAHNDGEGFMAEVVVRDETMAGRAIGEWVLPDLPDHITARELVRLRVREEVARFNAIPARRDTFAGLVRPAEPSRSRVDWQAQAEIACAGFASNAFVMIAGDRQIEDLDEVIDLERAHAVSFIRLTPLVGG